MQQFNCLMYFESIITIIVVNFDSYFINQWFTITPRIQEVIFIGLNLMNLKVMNLQFISVIELLIQ